MYGRENFERDLAVSRETSERLLTHLKLLQTWAPRLNLVGPGQLDGYWQRHALDCGQLVLHAPEALRWVDLGSGAGFPGLVIACLLAGREGALVTLVESNHKKAAFLREAIRETGAPARVAAMRVEDVLRVEEGAQERETYEVCTARAFAPLARIIETAEPILSRGAVGLFLKGSDAAAELAEAQRRWEFDSVQTLPSLSDPSGRIVRLEGAKRVGSNAP